MNRSRYDQVLDAGLGVERDLQRIRAAIPGRRHRTARPAVEITDDPRRIRGIAGGHESDQVAAHHWRRLESEDANHNQGYRPAHGIILNCVLNRTLTRTATSWGSARPPRSCPIGTDDLESLLVS